VIIGGWMFAAFSLAQFLCAPLAGNLSDRFGRRPLLLLAIFGLGSISCFSAVAPTLFWLFVGRMLAGICGSSWMIANAYIADITAPEDRGRAFGMMGAAFGVGFVIGPAVGGLLGRVGAAGAVLCGGGGLAAELRLWLVRAARDPAAGKPPAVRSGAGQPVRCVPGVFAAIRGCCRCARCWRCSSSPASVYPAIWPFWGMARFGWSEAMVG
jgi:DHA1 family tetracycline resistance protein-like MFS transporter